MRASICVEYEALLKASQAALVKRIAGRAKTVRGSDSSGNTEQPDPTKCLLQLKGHRRECTICRSVSRIESLFVLISCSKRQGNPHAICSLALGIPGTEFAVFNLSRLKNVAVSTGRCDACSMAVKNCRLAHIPDD
jgi:hypothetical protein